MAMYVHLFLKCYLLLSSDRGWVWNSIIEAMGSPQLPRFMPWPEAALVAVSSAFLGSYKCLGSELRRPCNTQLYCLTLFCHVSSSRTSIGVKYRWCLRFKICRQDWAYQNETRKKFMERKRFHRCMAVLRKEEWTSPTYFKHSGSF